MTSVKIGALAIVAAGVYALLGTPGPAKIDNTATNVEKAVHWLVSVQGRDGGWGQDGGETSYVRAGEHLETNGNDVANTAGAPPALVHPGHTPGEGEDPANLRRGARAGERRGGEEWGAR